MLRFLSWFALALLVACPTGSVQAVGGDPVADAKRAVEPLALEFKVAENAMRDRLSAMRETPDYKEAYEAKEWDKLRALSDGIVNPVMEEWKEKFAGVAKLYASKEAELVVAAAQLRLRLLADPGEAVERLVDAYASSAHLGGVIQSPRVPQGMKPERFAALMTKVIEENASKEIQAQAYFNRGSSHRRGRDLTDEQKAASEADFTKVIELLPSDALLSLKAQGPRFEETRLQTGMKAPDIAGVDLFGEKFKLSDYAGKVVMLDFWGDW